MDALNESHYVDLFDVDLLYEKNVEQCFARYILFSERQASFH